MMRKLLLACVLYAFFSVTQAWADPASEQAGWPAWVLFQEKYISPEGRVIDWSDERHITTSEGQSYAMFLALVHNDQALFRKLLTWTETHLAQGDLGLHLPAWLWGRLDDGAWGVIDANSAADSDLWIAYSLLEAGRLWDLREYRVLGNLLLQRIEQYQAVQLPGFGALLLPAAKGFEKAGQWRLNPSYLPPQLVERARLELTQHTFWSELSANTPTFLLQSAPLGLAPDWLWWRDGQWDWQSYPQASYNAIRVYLWVGMLDRQAAQADTLKAHFRQALPYLDVHGLPAEKVNVTNGLATGKGPVGFSAALLPLFADHPFGQAQRARMEDADLTRLGYYSFVLWLFGSGWSEGRYTFDASGYLHPMWSRP